MASRSPTGSRSVSGHLRLRRGTHRTTWYAKWRDADGVSHQDKLGLLWPDTGAPAAGYLREQDAEMALQAILTAARRGASGAPINGTVGRRSARDRPAKSPLSRDAVVEAALAILTSEGLEAVTMRRVALALDTGAASLYAHVSGREGLLEAMLDRVTATIELEAPDPARWRAQLHSLLARMHRALVAHPGIAAITLADSPTTDAVLLLAENLLGILLAGGLEPQDAAWTCDIFVLLVTAIASEDDVRRARDRRDDGDHVDALQRRLAGLPPDRFPLIAAHAAQMVAGDGGERFRFAIDAVVDGVLARAARR